jgi:quercetin dioxygenase-like cupin family protein
MPQYFFTPAAAADFRDGELVKLDLARGQHLFVGLNCFEPGQSQPVHSHAGADKFYLILSGNARMIVGDEQHDAGPGTLVWAPASVPHGVARTAERTVMLIALGPPP